MGEDEEARQARETAATVDVAMTPAAPGPLPIPYPDVAADDAESPVVQLIDRIRTELTDLFTTDEE